MSKLALEGFQYQPSSSRFLKLHTNNEELDLPGICSVIQNSSNIETLIIDWHHQDRGVSFLYAFNQKIILFFLKWNKKQLLTEEDDDIYQHILILSEEKDHIFS